MNEMNYRMFDLYNILVYDESKRDGFACGLLVFQISNLLYSLNQKYPSDDLFVQYP